MSLIDDALAAKKAQLIAAFWDDPVIRTKLTMAEISTAVDTAFKGADVPALLQGLVAAEAVVAAVVADVAVPPPSVSTAVDDYTPARTEITDRWGDFYNEP